MKMFTKMLGPYMEANSTIVSVSEDSSREHNVTVNLECSASGCTFVGSSGATAVAAAPLCKFASALEQLVDGQKLQHVRKDCENALLVIGKNRFVTGDSMTLLSTNQATPSENADVNYIANHTIRLVNPSIRTELSIGVMQWTTSDLAKRFGAKCVASNNLCQGLHFSLDSDSSHALLVAEHQLPVSALSTPVLVHVTSGIVRPSDFKIQDWDGSVLKDDKCSAVAENYIEYVEQNHLFEERGKIEYVTLVSGMFHLFEKARLYDVVPVTQTVELNSPVYSNSTETTLNFDGNFQLVRVGVFIPWKAALLSVVSMLGVLYVSLYVLLVELLSRSEDDVEPLLMQSSVLTTAEVMFDGTQYPKQYLAAQIMLTSSTDDGDQQIELRDLDEFVVEGATLRLQAATPASAADQSVLWELRNRQSRAVVCRRSNNALRAFEEEPAMA